MGKWYEEKDQLKSLKISNTYGLQERTYFAGWSSGTPSKEISPVGISTDTTIDYLNTYSEKSKNSDAQSDTNSSFSSYKDTNSNSLYKEELKEQYEDMKIIYRWNNDYTTTNSMYSLWLARDYLEEGTYLIEG